MSESTNTSYIYLYKRIFPFVKPYLFRFIVAMLITIPIGALDAVIALSLRPYMDIVMIKKNLNLAWYIPLAIVGFTVIQGVLNYFATYLNGWLGQKITNDIKLVLYKKLLKIETSFFDKQNTGYILMRFDNDPNSVTDNILNNTKQMLTRVFSSISLIAVMLYNSWLLAIIGVTIISLILIPLTLIRKRVKNISNSLVKTGGNLLSRFNETISGNRIITSYNLEKHQSKRFTLNQKEIFGLNMKITKINGWLTPFTHIVASIGIAAVIGYGSYLIMAGKLSSGAFVSFITALIMLYTPLKGIGNMVISTHKSFVAVERVIELFDYDFKIKSKDNAVKLDSIKTGIKFENVWFEYEKDKPVLKDLNLEINLGETVALVGNSGGGKSTFVNLIPRFYDIIEGRITIDDIDVRDLELYSLREKIAIVFQDNFLFEGTIRENILLGKLDATEEKIQEALKGAYLDEFITGLENGLDTQIGERGILLSGGQKQRIAIARALLKNSPIVILDEATSSLDNKSEAVVQKALDKLMQNRTVFVIAHRLSTVQNASRIVVINEGQIVEIGNHEELVAKPDGVYRNLYLSQFKQTNDKNIDVIQTV